MSPHTTSSILTAIPTLAASVASSLGTVNALTNRIPGGSSLKRRALTTLVVRAGWFGVPLAIAGLSYWGWRTWQRAKVRSRQAENLGELGKHDKRAPQNPVDESSWESFPASDPPAVSPGPAPVKFPS